MDKKKTISVLLIESFKNYEKKTKTSLRNNWTIEIPKFGVKPRTQSIKN